MISMLLFTRVKQENIISWPMILMFYVCAQICYWSWWEVQTKNYIPESSSLLSCVLLLQSWMISQVFVWIIPAKRSLFWFSSGFVCFFQKKNTNFPILKFLFGSTSRGSMKLLPKQIQGTGCYDQGQGALYGISSSCIATP